MISDSNLTLVEAVPRKSTPPLTDEERAKRIRETAREVEASDSKREFERAFTRVVSASKNPESRSASRRKSDRT
jgi:hypothetical protein